MANQFDDNQDFDFDDANERDEGVDEEPAEESSNRSFWIAVTVLGIVILLTLICLVAFFFISRNSDGGGRSADLTAAADARAQQTQQAEAVALTSEAAAWTATPTITPPPTNTSTPTNVVVQATDTPGGAANELTQTVEALLTLAAQSTPVNTSTALPTTLPDTGFFDEIGSGGFGLLGLMGLAVLAIVLIFFARRLRAASS